MTYYNRPIILYMCCAKYLTIGDGGNSQGPYRTFIDDVDPENNKTVCGTRFEVRQGSMSTMLPIHDSNPISTKE